jgi:hypothetical protein
MKPYREPPMTLGNAAAAEVRLIVWPLDRARPPEMAKRHGGEVTIPDDQEAVIAVRLLVMLADRLTSIRLAAPLPLSDRRCRSPQ